MTDPRPALRAFVEGLLSASDLLVALQPFLTVVDSSGTVSVTYADTVLPHVVFKREHVAKVLQKCINGEVPIDDVAQWANLMTLLDCFDLHDDAASDDDVWDVLDRMAHPEQAGIEEAWQLRILQDRLSV